MTPSTDTARPQPTFDVYYGEDGTLVVHVDTEGVDETADGPLIRIYLNDEAVFENPPYNMEPK